MKIFTLVLTSMLMTSCSVLGDNGVNSAPYTLLTPVPDKKIEVRNYKSMVLVSAPMAGESGNSAFRKLFAYISGENQGATEIAMTAPVFMSEKDKTNQGTEIAMTAPVFMGQTNGEPMMSFVMPADFTLATTPLPTDPEVKVSELKNFKVAAIEFNGTLSDSNVQEHQATLRQWLSENGYVVQGEAITAGYNGPLTLPWMRKNEVLIAVK